jgi:hypothetical protein
MSSCKTSSGWKNRSSGIFRRRLDAASPGSTGAPGQVFEAVENYDRSGLFVVERKSLKSTAKKLTGIDRIKTNDECGMMNDEFKTKAFCFSFRIHHSAFIISIHPC